MSFMIFDLRASTLRSYPQTEATLMCMERLKMRRYHKYRTLHIIDIKLIITIICIIAIISCHLGW